MSGLRGRPAIALVARREVTQRIREKSFLISMGVTVALVVLVAVVPPLFGFGGKETFTIAVADEASLAVAKAADRGAKAFDTDLKIRRLSAEDPNEALADGNVDAVLSTRGLQAEEAPDQTLLGILETARREVQQTQALQRAGLSPAQVRQASTRRRWTSRPRSRSTPRPTARGPSRSSRCSPSTPSC